MIPTPDEKPALLVVTTTFPRYRDDSGPAPFVFHLARALDRYFRVTVLCPHDPQAALKENLDGLEVIRFRYFIPSSAERLTDGKGIINNMRRGLLSRLQALPLLAAEFFAALRMIRHGRFTMVNSHWLVPSGLVVALLRLFFDFRHVITVHAADYFLLRRVPAGKAILHFILQRADAVLAVSESIREGMIQMGAPGGKILVQPMGADLELFGAAQDRSSYLIETLGLENKFIVLFVGKLSAKKGIEYLIDAVALLCAKMSDLHLVIVGEGFLRDSLERRAKEKGISDLTTFVGARPQAELPDYYRMSSVVVVPSILDEHGESEGMPVVILEALASGRPVIGTGYCSAPESLKGRGFIEVKENDASALAQAIEDVYEGRGPGVDAAALRAFDWTEVAQVYVRALQDGKKGS